MEISIDPNAMLELAFARLDLDQAWESRRQAQDNCRDPNGEQQKVRNGYRIRCLQDDILEAAAAVNLQLGQGQTVDWSDFDWAFAWLDSEQKAEAERALAQADLEAAEAAVQRAERRLETLTVAICQSAGDDFDEAEQAEEVAKRAEKQAFKNRRQARVEAVALIEQARQIRREGDSGANLETLFARSQRIKSLLDQAQEVVGRAEAELEQAGKDSSKAFWRRLRARKQREATEREVDHQLSRMIGSLERRSELVTA